MVSLQNWVLGDFEFAYKWFQSKLLKATSHMRLRARDHYTSSTHWWKRWSWSKFASHYAWGTNGVCERKMDVKSICMPTWHQMDHVSWLLGLFSKTASSTIFNILREWDPLKIILAIWPPKSHVRLINTRSYFRRVVSIKMRVCWAGIDSFRLSRPKWG
jgi:hypothetical protein